VVEERGGGRERRKVNIPAKRCRGRFFIACGLGGKKKKIEKKKKRAEGRQIRETQPGGKLGSAFGIVLIEAMGGGRVTKKEGGKIHIKKGMNSERED